MASACFDLSGRVAVVTGGNGGIGLAIATALAEAGAKLAIVGRDEAKNGAAQRQLRDAGAEVVAVRADVTTSEGCTAVVDAALGRFGSIDILVNNAGTNMPHSSRQARLGRRDDVDLDDHLRVGEPGNEEQRRARLLALDRAVAALAVELDVLGPDHVDGQPDDFAMGHTRGLHHGADVAPGLRALRAPTVRLSP